MNAYHFRFNPFRLLVSLNNVLKHLETGDKIKSHQPYGPLVVSVMSGTSEDGALRGF